MLVNVNNFKEYLKRATLNHTIDFFQVNVTKDKVNSKLIPTTRDIITIIEWENKLFSDIKDEFTINFINPKTELRPFLELIDEEEVSFKIKKNKIVLNNQIYLQMSIPGKREQGYIFQADKPMEGVEYFIKVKTDDDFLSKMTKIRKIGNRFGKIYFTVKDNGFYVETTDKMNPSSSSLSYKLKDFDSDSDSFTLCFDYSNVNNLLNVIGDEDFEIGFSYMEEHEKGFLHAHKDKENYYLLSKKDE